MPWARFDDGLYDHPKLDELGRLRLPGVGLLVLCVSWSNRFLTDGHIPSERIMRLGGTLKLAGALVDVGLLERDGSDFLVHDFHDYSPTRAQVVNERARSRERMAAVRANTGRTTTEVHSAPSSPVPTIPVHSNGNARKAPKEMTDAEAKVAYHERQSELVGIGYSKQAQAGRKR